jgi:DNA-binding MarR family transcriptional regulator
VGGRPVEMGARVHRPDGTGPNPWDAPGRYSVARPNSTEPPNISADPNRQPTAAAVEAVVEHYDRMMQRLIGGHAPEFTEVGITMAQAKVLYVVTAAGRLRLSELAARLQIGSSSASELVERLVELGLLHRGADPDDRRQVVITVTPEAHALLERFRELNQRQLRELLGRLDAG